MLAFILGNGIAVMTDRGKLFFRNIAVFFDIALAFVIARPGQQDPAGSTLLEGQRFADGNDPAQGMGTFDVVQADAAVAFGNVNTDRFVKQLL